MSLTSTVNTVQASSTLTQQSTINSNITQEINSANASQSAAAEPQPPSSSHFDGSPLGEDPNYYLANLRSKSGTHEFHALNVQTHTGSYFISPSPCYPLRVDNQGSEKRLKLSSSEQNNQPPPSASQLQPQPQHTSPPGGSVCSITSGSTPLNQCVHSTESSVGCNPDGGLSGRIRSDSTNSYPPPPPNTPPPPNHPPPSTHALGVATHTVFAPYQPEGYPNLYVSPPDGATTNLFYAQRAIQNHPENQLCVTPQSDFAFATQTEFANLVPSGTHYCSTNSIAGAYEIFQGGKDDIDTIATKQERKQLEREKQEREGDSERQKYKSTGSNQTSRQAERASAQRAPRHHSYLYDGAPAERNIIDMVSATNAPCISHTPVPHINDSFPVPVEELVNFHVDASVKARNEFIPSLLVTGSSVDDTLSSLQPQNEERGGTHAYAEHNPDTLSLDEKLAQKAKSSKSLSNEYLFEEMNFDELLAVIQLPSQSKSTAKAISASLTLDLDDSSSNLLTRAIIALLTCTHEWTQTTAARFLAESIQTGDTWKLIVAESLSAAKSILEISKDTSRAKSIRNLINRSISACPALTSGAVLDFCKHNTLPPHISNLLGEWALKFTSSSEALAWHSLMFCRFCPSLTNSKSKSIVQLVSLCNCGEKRSLATPSLSFYGMSMVSPRDGEVQTPPSSPTPSLQINQKASLKIVDIREKF